MMLHSTGETADLAADDFLPAGRWDFVITPDAARRQARIDLLHGDDILLHIKVLPERERMVLNDRIGGRWGSEIHIPAPPSVTAADMHVRLTRHLGVLKVGFAEGDSADYARHADLIAQALLKYSHGIHRVTGLGGLNAGLIKGTIRRADVMHIAGTLQFPDLRWTEPARLQGGRLVLLVDGRPGGFAALPVPASEDFMPAVDFTIVADDGALIGDGMIAEVAVELGGAKAVVGSSRIMSRFAGGVERCNESMVSGFVCNPDLPSRPALVDVFINDVFQATVPALEPRPDLEALGLSPECGGFRFRYANPIHLPVSADALVSVRVHNTDIELAHSPWRVSQAVCMTRNLAGPCPEMAHEQGAV